MSKRKKKLISTDAISVKELLELIPPELIDDLAHQYQADKWVKKLKASYFFKLILFSLLNSERLSLRIMEENYEDPLFQALAPALVADTVAWTGIRDRLINIKSVFFQKLYESVYNRARELYGGKRLEGYHIRTVSYTHLTLPTTPYV